MPIIQIANVGAINADERINLPNIYVWIVRLEGNLVIVKSEMESTEELIQKVLIGGNHLAAALWNVCDPTMIKTYNEAVEILSFPYIDIWAAWKAIMNLAEYRNTHVN